MLAQLDWTIVGLTLNVVGVFFLASSITFKKPKRLLWEFFGIRKTGSLGGIREYLLNKVQVYIGFVFLIAGFLVQMGVILVRQPSATGQVLDQPNFLIIVALLVASIIGVTILLRILQLVWSHRVFRRLLIEFFRENEWPLAQHPTVAKEIGELLHVPQEKDESIDDYISKIRNSLRIDGGAGKPRRAAGTAARGGVPSEARR